jgi:hypothetical protein
VTNNWKLSLTRVSEYYLAVVLAAGAARVKLGQEAAGAAGTQPQASLSGRLPPVTVPVQPGPGSESGALSLNLWPHRV